MSFQLPRIYPITDTRLSGLTHAEQVARLALGGATLVQLREKNLTPREFYEQVVAARDAAGRAGIQLIINDRVDIALAIGADGVHLGQDDIPPQMARAVLGPEAIIGFSTHSIKQLAAAADLPVDYVAYGPIFPTGTKADPEPSVGVAGLRQARIAAGERPLVAIGGIGAASVEAVLKSGASSVAMIGALVAEPDEIEARFARLSAMARRINRVATS